MYRDLIEDLPLMVQEREKQADDLETLAAQSLVDRAFLDEFRRLAADGGIGTLLRVGSR